MSINEARQKIKTSMALIEKREVYGSILIVFVSICSFSLGRLSFNESNRTPVTVENTTSMVGAEIFTTQNREVTSPTKTVSMQEVSSQTGNYVASKSGKRFYLPTCSSVKTIKDSNKIWFGTKEDALAAGYTPALNCEGI